MLFTLLATGALAVTPPEDCTTVNAGDCKGKYNPYCEWKIEPTRECITRTQYGCYEYTEAEQKMIDDGVKTAKEVCLDAGAHEGFKYEGDVDTHVFCGDCDCCAPANCEGIRKALCFEDPVCAFTITDMKCHPAVQLGCDTKGPRDCLKNPKCALTKDKLCINAEDMTCELKYRKMRDCRKDGNCMVLGTRGDHTCTEKDCHLYNQKGCTHDPGHMCAWDSDDGECLDLDEIECSHIHTKAGCLNVAKHDGHCMYAKQKKPKGQKCMKPCDYNSNNIGADCGKSCCDDRDPKECQWLATKGTCQLVPGFNCHDLDDSKKDCNKVDHCQYNGRSGLCIHK